MGMENLMKALMESAAQSQGQGAPQQGGGDLLSGVLGGLMGGAQQPMPQQSAGGDLLSGVLGGLMGGGQPATPQQSGGDQMLGMLEQIIGGQPGTGQMLPTNQAAYGMGGMGAANPLMGLLQPVINQVAAKVNISPQIATVVASIALHYLLSSHPSTSPKAPMDFGGVIQELNAGGITHTTLNKSGMVTDVMQATGLNKQTSLNSLDAIFGMLGSALQGTAR